MLSLVAYGNSDDSGSESDSETHVGNVPAEVQVPDVQTNVSVKEADISSKLDSPIITGDESTRSVSKEPGKLTSLPSSLNTSINFDLKILDKNRSQPIRITIPSLKELEKDEEPDRKPKLKPSTKGSGLFSLLPEPKNVTSSVSKGLVPQSVANTKKTKPKKLVPQKVTKKHKSKIHDDDDDEEDEGKPLNSFFFPSHDDVPLPPVDVYFDSPVTPSDVTSSTSVRLNHISGISAPVGLDSSTQPPTDMIYPSSVNSPKVTSTHSDTDDIEEPSLDSAALLKLCGARGRRKGPDLSEIIDVSGSSLIGDNSLQLAKELSKEQPSHSFKRKSECSSLQRRKHQITYLAEQAKAQELELRNNWAQNRMTRKQTQAKYGF